MYYLYNLLACLALTAALPVLLARGVVERGFYRRLRQGLGELPQDVVARVAGRRCIWLHAASVGEIVAASAIVREIKRVMPKRPVLLSVYTATGFEMACRIVPEAAGVLFFPFDLPWLVAKFLDAIKPRAFIMVETELWPNFLREAKKRGVCTMLVNGRISDRSAKQYKYMYGLLRDMLDNVDVFCMRSRLDADYILHLGADPARVFITGDTKFDQTYTAVSPAEVETLRTAFGLQDRRPLVVAGSTHPGEEREVFAAMEVVRQAHRQAGLVIAPRKTERAAEVAALAKQSGFTPVCRTALSADDGQELCHDTVILDTIGELGRVYSLADVVFVGGSLVKLGGHNVLEPAAHGKPILVGPHMDNFRESFALLAGRGACLTVRNGRELGEAICRILADPARQAAMADNARAVLTENRGAAAKSVDHLQNLLAEDEASHEATGSTADLSI